MRRRETSRRRDVERFVGAAVAFALATVVAPLVLLAVSRARFGSGSPLAGVPAPTRWRLDDVSDTLTRPLDDDTVADLLIRSALVVAWLALAAIVVTTVAELFHMWRHRGLGLPAVRGLRWAQPVSHFIASGLIVFASLGTPRIALSSALPVASAPIAFDVGGTSAARADPTSLRAAPSPAARTTDAAAPVHVVARGDSVYSIASVHAGGDPARTVEIADEILDLNLGCTMVDGSVFTNPAYIEIGWRLVLPSSDGLHLGADLAEVYVVEVGDTLSDIAERHLGEAAQWTRIWSVNAGSEMIDGRRFEDPDLILPGWRLVLPDVLAHEPNVADTEPDVVADTGEPHVDMEPDIADTDAEPDVVADLDDEEPQSEVVADLDDGEEAEQLDEDLGDEPVPSVVGPGHLVPPEPTLGTDVEPAVPAPPPIVIADAPGREHVPASVPTAPVLTTTPTTTAVPAGNGGPAGGPATEEGLPSSPNPIRIEHAALLAVGVLSIVAVRRRQRLRASLPRTRIPAPRPDGADIERRLRQVDAGERMMRVDVAVRAAAATLAGDGAQIAFVVASPDGAVTLDLTAEAVLPPPWIGAGTRWSVPGSAPVELLAAEARKVALPCVALAQVGVDGDGADVLVDLEACGVLDVCADHPAADAIVTAIATSTASSPFAEVAHLVTASLPDTALLDHRGVQRVGSADDAVACARDLAGAVAAQDRPSFELRALRTGGEVWEPAVVFLTSGEAGAIDDGDIQPGRGIAVVRAQSSRTTDVDHHGAGCTLTAEDDHWMLSGFGASIDLTPVGATDADLAAVGQLLADASAPLAEADHESTRSEHSDPCNGSLDHRITVSLVGAVAVTDADGNEGTFDRGKSVELITWLATHRDRSTRTAARTALWELDVRDATFANVVSEARRGLARLVPPPEGQEWVARTLTEALPLHDLVVTDADLIEHRLTAARVEPPDRAIETLRPAVDLVRGMPFAGTSYLWPDAEGITSSLVLLAMSACTELAAHALSVGDVETVFWATGRGLTVLPGHEELVGLRMRAHARAGDLAGVRQEWESYERVIVADAWSDGEPAPKLLDLRRELLP